MPSPLLSQAGACSEHFALSSWHLHFLPILPVTTTRTHVRDSQTNEVLRTENLFSTAQAALAAHPLQLQRCRCHDITMTSRRP